jgi:hypothetical protein
VGGGLEECIELLLERHAQFYQFGKLFLKLGLATLAAGFAMSYYYNFNKRRAQEVIKACAAY